MREEVEGSFESNVQSTWLVCLWEMYSRAPQINQKTEFWYFTLTTGSYMKDGQQKQASANTVVFPHYINLISYYFLTKELSSLPF